MDRGAGRGGCEMDKPEIPVVEEMQKVLRHVTMQLDALGERDDLVASTEENYEDFCAGVMLYTRLFGLTDWHINFRWENNDSSTAACVYYNYESRAATFVFSREINRFFRDSPVFMMRLALHETLHLLLAEFDYINNADNLIPSQRKALLETAEHGVIRRLENVLLSLPKLKSDDYLIHRLHGDKHE